MNLVHLVAVLAILQYVLFSALVGRARVRYRIAAPATTGHALFERAYRVQMNTLEQLVAFLPALWLAAQYYAQSWVAGLGAVYLVGRFLYRGLYMANPDKRAPGFLLTFLPIVVLLLMALWGVFMHPVAG